MARTRQRVIALFFAAIFILSSSVLTIAVLWQSIQGDKKANEAATDPQSQLKEASMDPNKLQGKPLAGFTPVATIAELQKVDTTPGTGKEVKAGDTVTVDYTGAVASTGVVFESSKDSGKPIPLSLSQVIAGWSQGIPGMKEGGTRRLLIPAELAYGAQGAGTIPPNADLVFDVTVHKVGK